MSSKATTPVSPNADGNKHDDSHYACSPREPLKQTMEHAEQYGIGSGVYYRNTDVRGRKAEKKSY